MPENKPPPIKTHIAARTAEMLGLPQLVCRRRDCRRNHCCRWNFPSTGEPCCLRNLTVEQRRLFDVVYHDANAASHFLGTDPYRFEALAGARRAADDLAIAIARTDPHRRQWQQWDAARRAREKRLAQFDKERTSGKDG